MNATQGAWPERAGFQLPHQRREVILEVRLKHVDAYLVYSSGPSVSLHRLEGLSHQRERNSPGERMHFYLFAHGEPFTLCNHRVRTKGLSGAFLSTMLSEWRIGAGSSGFPARARAGQFRASVEGLTLLMDCLVVLRLRSVSPFTDYRERQLSYSGSAATLKEEAVKATFSSPPHCRVISPKAYTLDLPTVGRRRASPVMHQDRFLQAATRNTSMGHHR